MIRSKSSPHMTSRRVLLLSAVIISMLLVILGNQFDRQTHAAPSVSQTAKLFAVSAVTNEVFRYQVTSAGAASLDLTITDASFDAPYGVAFSPPGEMFITNRGPQSSPGAQGSVTRILNAAGAPVANGTISSGNFAAPHHAAFRGDELFVVNRFFANVLRYRFDSAGNAIANGQISAGLGGDTPRGIAVAPWGELFVTECCGVDTIFRYIFDGSGNAIPNGTITGGMSNPHGMTFSPWGELLVANLNNSTVSRFTFDSSHTASINGAIVSGTFSGPIDVAFSPWGELFVSNHFSQGISRFTFDASHNVSQSGFISTPERLAAIAFGPQPPTCVPPPANLVSWWPGDGNSSDIVGNNHGTLQNGATFAPGMVGQAFSFDGVDDYVSVADDVSLRAIGAITIDFWASFDRVPRTGRFEDSFMILEKVGDYVVYWRSDGNGIQMDLTDACDGQAGLYHLGAFLPMPDLQPNEFHHYAFTAIDRGAQGPEFHFYVDGFERVPVLAVFTPHAGCGWFSGVTGELHIGNRPMPNTAPLYFDGLIDEVEIFHRALTSSEIQAIFNAGSAGKCKNIPCIPAPSGLIGWWPLDETGGTTAADIVGGNDGAHFGGASPVTGKVAGALSFDGSDDEVLVNSMFPFHQPGDATLEFWMNTPATGHQSVFWTRADDADQNRFNIFVNGDSTVGFDYRSSSGALHVLVGACCTGVSIPRNTWTHVGITRTNNVYGLYVNGVLASTATDASPDLPTATGWQMSGRSGAIYRGSLDEVELYNRALTASEIQGIFNAGSAGKCKNRCPVAMCHGVTVSAGLGCTANASIDNGSSDPDGDAITLNQSPPGPYALGTTSVTLTVTDSHGASSQCIANVTVVDNTPPSLACPTNINRQTDPNQCSAVVVYATPTVSDNCSGVGTPTCTPPSGATFPKGTTTVNCSVTDAAGNQVNCSFTVTVADTQAPTITMIAGQQMEFWPPNHQYQTVRVSDFVAGASDNCSGNLTNRVLIASISSDEPDDAPGGGDGNTTNDIVIAADCRTAQLRAERQGSGNGRVYTITFRVRDAAGNVKTATAKVGVPHSQNDNNGAVDDGPDHTVNSACP